MNSMVLEGRVLYTLHMCSIVDLRDLWFSVMGSIRKIRRAKMPVTGRERQVRDPERAQRSHKARDTGFQRATKMILPSFWKIYPPLNVASWTPRIPGSEVISDCEKSLKKRRQKERAEVCSEFQ